MRYCRINIEGTSPYSQSRNHEAPKLEKETHDDYDRRTWREKCTTNEAGNIVVPGFALKQAIDYAAGLLSIKVPGGGAKTYTKLFKTGIGVFDDLDLQVTKDQVSAIRLHVHANGQRGSGKRVFKHFPIVPAPWGGEIDVVVIDETIPNDVVEKVIVAAGRAAGVGRFRPENGGTNGRFRIRSFAWSEAA